jgi:heptosyltransferase-2/heptosyltransferase-3
MVDIAGLNPKRILFIMPCCIGDVVLATAALQALRRGFPKAAIIWAISSWARPVIEGHPLIDSVLDTGPKALPTQTPADFARFVRLIRRGKYDLAVSLVRSPLMGLAVALAGIPARAGLDSGGRGLGYNLRASISPDEARHEAEIFLDVVATLGLDVSGVAPNIPVRADDRESVEALLEGRGIERYFVVNPAGGNNPGMDLDIKRYPPEKMAALASRLSEDVSASAVLLGGPEDQALIDAVAGAMKHPPAAVFVGDLSFGQIAALAHDSLFYLGNDTGLTHLAAAAGAKTAMIFGPTDPARYGPYNDEAIALWKPISVQQRGVTDGAPGDFAWDRDGISVEDAEAAIYQFLHP